MWRRATMTGWRATTTERREQTARTVLTRRREKTSRRRATMTRQRATTAGRREQMAQTKLTRRRATALWRKAMSTKNTIINLGVDILPNLFEAR